MRGRTAGGAAALALGVAAIWPASAGAQRWPGADGGPGHTATIRLEVEPKTAEVYVDGYFAGIVDDFDGVFQRLRVLAGEREIELYLEGYRSATQRLFVTPGSSHRIRLMLEPLLPGEDADPRPQPKVLPAPAARAPSRPGLPAITDAAGFGRLAIRVQPADAEVFIDGDRWQGPAEADRLVVHLAAGDYGVEVRKDGYRTFVTNVRVDAGETTALNVSLPAR